MSQAEPALQSQLEATRRHLAADPLNPILLAKAVDLCLRAGQVDEAARHAQDAVDAHPQDAQLAHRQGIVLLAQGRPEEAAAVFESLLARHPDANIAHNLALACYRQRDFARACDVLQPYVRSADAQPLAVTLYLRSLHQLGDLATALDIAHSRVSACGSDPEFLAVASLLSVDANELDEAARLSAAALATGARPVEALIAAASIALVQADLRRAALLFEEVLAVHPSDPRSRVGLGITKLLAGDAAAAKRLLAKAVDADPTDVGALQLLAWCHLAREELPQAGEVLRQALARDGSVASIHGALAVVRSLAGDAAGARQGIERATQLDPQDVCARLARSILAGEPVRPDQLPRNALAFLSTLGVRASK